MPWISSRKAPIVPASNWPSWFVTVRGSGRFTTDSRISSSASPRPRAISRIGPPQTIVGTPGVSIGGVASIGWPMPTRFAHRVGLRVGGVVEELEGADLVDALAQAGEQQRDTSLMKPGSTPETKIDALPAAQAAPMRSRRSSGADSGIVEGVDRASTRRSARRAGSARCRRAPRSGGNRPRRSTRPRRRPRRRRRPRHWSPARRWAAGRTARRRPCRPWPDSRRSRPPARSAGFGEHDAQRRHADVARAPDDDPARHGRDRGQW